MPFMSSLIFILSFVALGLTSCGGPSGGNENAKAVNNKPKTQTHTQTSSFEIVNTFEHDGKAFTQGLVFHNGSLYEGTGEYGESTLRKVDLKTGKVDKKLELSDEVFGEGITIFGDKIFQLTWRDKTAYVYDVNTFRLLKEFTYSGEGWGLTHDDKNLIMSDGTHVLRFINPETFQTEKTLTVQRENGAPQMNLNELEYVKGEIWANIWHSESPDILGKANHIARIDPASGKITGWIDLNNISPDDVKRDSENTLNGIAYDATGDRLFVTGKNWKKLFEIKIVPPKAAQ